VSLSFKTRVGSIEEVDLNTTGPFIALKFGFASIEETWNLTQKLDRFGSMAWKARILGLATAKQHLLV
jgi:hypothetical protein